MPIRPKIRLYISQETGLRANSLCMEYAAMKAKRSRLTNATMIVLLQSLAFLRFASLQIRRGESLPDLFPL
jgi:hypothetical protein